MAPLDLIQPKNMLLGTISLVPRFNLFSLSVLSKTVENKNFNQKWLNSYFKARTQRMLPIKTKLIF